MTAYLCSKENQLLKWKALKCQTLGAAVHMTVLVAMCILFCSCVCTVCTKFSDSLMLCTFYLALSSAQFSERFQTLSCLPCALFCSCLCKVRSQVSDALSQALCNLSLAFLADFTHYWFYCSHTFHSFLSQNILCFSFGSKDMITAFTSSVLQVQQFYTAGIPLLEAYLLPIIELAKNPRTKRPLATWSRFIHMRVFHGVKMADLTCSCTNRKRSSNKPFSE